jgi:hypothetical protein
MRRIKWNRFTGWERYDEPELAKGEEILPLERVLLIVEEKIAKFSRELEAEIRQQYKVFEIRKEGGGKE